jgi:3-hydroxyisobutyrate dehydrogenase-like beta-hydroxyacid dehydrogenase
MNIQTVGLLSPGDMGHAIGAVLHEHGLRVITNLQDRSARTAELAKAAGMIDVADDRTLVREADVLLSILPPAQAYSFAERIAAALQETGTDVLFVDCNAIAPRTAQSIEQLITAAGAAFVDVGIIGGPPQPGREGPRLYASGPRAEDVAQLAQYGLDMRVLGPRGGQASGLKMCYASLTKGLTSLATIALVAAQVQGLQEALLTELQLLPLFNTIKHTVPAMPPKAYRWIGEMEEIALTCADLGLPPQMHQGAAALYRFVEGTILVQNPQTDRGKEEIKPSAQPTPRQGRAYTGKPKMSSDFTLGAETPEQRQRGQTLEDVISILASELEKQCKDN